MSSHNPKRPLAYVGVPVAFCLAGYLLIWLALQPVWNMATATIGFIVSDEAPSFDPNLTVTYDPAALKPTAASDGNGSSYINGKDVEFPHSGEQYGHIECADIGLDAPVYWYDSEEILAYGAGQSLISMPPGFNGPIILSGHNTTYFRCLQDAKQGNVIQFHTNYCEYEYTVTKVEVYNEDVLESLLIDKTKRQKEELILYTCYPFHAISGRKTDRQVVFAKRTAGQDVRWKEQG